jgi:hypothetical protein
VISRGNRATTAGCKSCTLLLLLYAMRAHVGPQKRIGPLPAHIHHARSSRVVNSRRREESQSDLGCVATGWLSPPRLPTIPERNLEIPRLCGHHRILRTRRFRKGMARARRRRRRFGWFSSVPSTLRGADDPSTRSVARGGREPRKRACEVAIRSALQSLAQPPKGAKLARLRPQFAAPPGRRCCLPAAAASWAAFASASL